MIGSIRVGQGADVTNSTRVFQTTCLTLYRNAGLLCIPIQGRSMRFFDV